MQSDQGVRIGLLEDKLLAVLDPTQAQTQQEHATQLQLLHEKLQAANEKAKVCYHDNTWVSYNWLSVTTELWSWGCESASFGSTRVSTVFIVGSGGYPAGSFGRHECVRILPCVCLEHCKSCQICGRSVVFC